MSEYDVIIVGAGHNGLTAGVELQRAGKKVLILEKTNWPGGQAATKELFKGYKHSVGAWALLIFREELIKYLEMDKEGFELIRPESSFTVFGDENDAPFIGYTDPIDLANHLVEDHGMDALDGFNKLGSFFATFKEVFEKYMHEQPPTLEEIIAMAPDEKTRRALSKLSYGSAIEVIREFFKESGKHGTIEGSLSASAIDGTHMGPFTKGSALSMSYHYTAGDTYDFKIPKGGIGTLSTSLQKVFERYGGEVRFKAIVEQFIVEDGAVVGVRMKDGQEISSRVVISTLDSKMTFGSLCEPGSLPTDFTNAVDDIEYVNGYLQVHMTIKRLPTFTNQLAFVNGTVQSWLVAYIKGPNTVVGPAKEVQPPWAQIPQLTGLGMPAAVFGRPLYRAEAKEAAAAVAAYTLIIDLSMPRPAPDALRTAESWRRYIDSKQFLGACPMGPAMVTVDELPSLNKTGTTTRINGVATSQGSLWSSDTPPAELLAALSRRIGFRPGDVVAFTPQVSGTEAAEQTLRAGDEMSVSVDGIMNLTVKIAG